MNTDEVLKIAPPRPWHYQEDSDVYTHVIRDVNHNFVTQFSQREDYEARARLVVLAVNSYEADRALIEQLVTALEAVVRFCPSYPGEVEVALAAAKERSTGY